MFITRPQTHDAVGCMMKLCMFLRGKKKTLILEGEIMGLNLERSRKHRITTVGIFLHFHPPKPYIHASLYCATRTMKHSYLKCAT